MMKKLIALVSCCVFLGLLIPAYGDADTITTRTVELDSVVHTLSVQKNQTEPVTFLIQDAFAPQDSLITDALITVLVNEKKIPKRLTIEFTVSRKWIPTGEVLWTGAAKSDQTVVEIAAVSPRNGSANRVTVIVLDNLAKLFSSTIGTPASTTLRVYNSQCESIELKIPLAFCELIACPF